MKFIPVGACPVCHFYLVLSKFGHKKTAAKCSIYNSCVLCLFSYFWIELSMCYCSKSADKGQGLAEKRRKENQRGLGILPCENFIIRTVGKYGEFCSCVRTWAVLAILVFRHSRRVCRYFDFFLILFV